MLIITTFGANNYLYKKEVTKVPRVPKVLRVPGELIIEKKIWK